MDPWSVTSSDDGRYVHRLREGFGHALVVPIVVRVFQALGVSASLWDGRFWWSLHSEPSIAGFELEHGFDTDRYAYNERMRKRVLAAKKSALGEHAGYADFFVPIAVDGRVVALLVAGPFATVQPAVSRVLDLWFQLSGRAAHLADPEFDAYLTATFAVLVLEGERTRTFRELLECVARLMAGSGSAEALVNRADELRVELEGARVVERVWEAVRAMVDERSTRVWAGSAYAYRLRELGLSHVPDQVLVGVTVSRDPHPDPVDEVLRCHALQRRSVEIARRLGHAIAGPLGRRGVILLSAAPGSARRKRDKLAEFAERVGSVARTQFGLTAHFGASAVHGSGSISHAYQAALAAAESALAGRVRLVMAEIGVGRATGSLRELRRQLARSAAEEPATLTTRYDSYLEAVAQRSGYHLEIARGELNAAFETMTEPFTQSGALDAKSFTSLADALDRASETADNLPDLFAAHRRAVLDLASALEQPNAARRDRSLRRALDHIAAHYTEPLRLPDVAKLAGLTPNYFSQLFKQSQHTTFAAHVLGLRLERARQLLSSTRIPIARVAELCGFHSPQYFSRTFARVSRLGPREYRERALEGRAWANPLDPRDRPRKSTSKN